MMEALKQVHSMFPKKYTSRELKTSKNPLYLLAVAEKLTPFLSRRGCFSLMTLRGKNVFSAALSLCADFLSGLSN